MKENKSEKLHIFIILKLYILKLHTYHTDDGMWQARSNE